MQRSSLLVAFILTAACGPAASEDAGGGHDAESAVNVTTVAPTAVSLNTALGTTTSKATLIRPVKPQADACVNYDSLTAALGSRTLDCLGTVGPDTYAVDNNGRLVPRFEKCTQDPPKDGDEDVYGDILALLSVQDRKEAPDAARCIGGRYAEWRKSFDATGIKNCPVWKRVETLNAPTERTIEAIAAKQPKLPAKPGTVQAVPHENYLMELGFPDGVREERCKDEADCANKCSAGFKGMWIEGEGTKALIDPSYWLITLNFGESNPFMSAGYYHPMSFSGTVPGALYGHRNRKGEPCSRYVLGEHILLSLQLDCIDPSVPTSCMTVCAEPVAETAGTESKSSY